MAPFPPNTGIAAAAPYRNPFDYMKPSDDMQDIIRSVRNHYKELHAHLMQLPMSRERSLAITDLETSAMWAIKGLVINDPQSTTLEASESVHP